ncbi:MAG: hypothetical protein M3256_22750 [Actinomycetota bacterium]|nr:hypothetical protein [Actinomycetota bacterium]
MTVVMVIWRLLRLRDPEAVHAFEFLDQIRSATAHDRDHALQADILFE